MNLVALLGFALLVLGICKWLGVLASLHVSWMPLVIVGGCILAVTWAWGRHRL